jgi:predicted choloylglycine hydrolase
MTKPWHVDVLQCRGSAYDIGRQMAEGFRKTARGRAYGRRKERRPFAFNLKNAEAALKTWAPNIWEELHGLADGLAIPLERAVAEYSNGRLRYELRGCSAVMTAGLYGRNYDYDTRRYDRILVAVQAKGVHASIGFSDRFTGRVDGMNEHGLCVGLHMVTERTWKPGLVCILLVRMVLDQCATTREAVALLRRVPHGTGFNYSLLDAGGAAAVVEASPAALDVREGERLACTNHFQSSALQAYNRRNPGSHRHLPPLETMARERPQAAPLFQALNNSLSAVFDHRYGTGSGTLHTIVCTPAMRQMMVGVGGDATPQSIDLGDWVRGTPLPIGSLEGQLGGNAKPFDPTRRRVVSASGHGSAANVFIGTPLNAALFKNLTLAKATFANVSLAGASFDDIDFSNATITGNCNFRGMRIAGVAVTDLLAAFHKRRA